MQKQKNNSVFSGLFWTFGERIVAQLVTTIVTIILARLLDPEHYGMISIVTVFISLCNIFVSSGFGSAVVQKKDVNDNDFNTAFVISFSISLLLYIILFFGAPLVSKFYRLPELTNVIRVMGVRLIIASLNTIQHSYIQRQMKFKKFFFATLFGTMVSAVVGVLFALLGFGVWALVAQYLTNSIIDTIVLYFICEWKPKIKYDKKKAKGLFSFGWKVLCTELIFTLEGDLRSLIVGKVFGSSDLAFYDQGKKYPSLLVTNINSSLNKVMFPAFSRQQDNIIKIKEMLRKTIKIGTYLLAPVLIGFAIVSNKFVLLLLTDKWLPAVPFIQIFCIIYLTRPLETTCHQALLAIGKSGLVMKMMAIINIFALFTLLISVFVFENVFYIAIGSLMTQLVSLILFMFEASRRLEYSFREQLNDFISPIIVSLIMGVVVFFIGKINLTFLVSLILQIATGIFIYLFLSIVLNLDGFIYLRDKFVCMIHKKKTGNYIKQ